LKAGKIKGRSGSELKHKMQMFPQGGWPADVWKQPIPDTPPMLTAQSWTSHRTRAGVTHPTVNGAASSVGRMWDTSLPYHNNHTLLHSNPILDYFTWYGHDSSYKVKYTAIVVH
jgi:hypothetical protein